MLPECRLLAERDGQVLGWAALTAVSPRKVYAGVAEVSIYIATEVWGQGVGSRLLPALVADSEQHGFWTLQAGIFPENDASIRLHENCGFKLLGTLEKLGRQNGRWRDVVLLARRSAVVS